MEEIKCTICLELIGNRATYTTYCNHIFHDSCIQTWKHYQPRARRTCPLCRKELARLRVHLSNTNANPNAIDNFTILVIFSVLIYFILYFIRVREEIHDYSMCQIDAYAWCRERGYTWFKSESNSPLCNIDYCYRYTYNFQF